MPEALPGKAPPEAMCRRCYLPDDGINNLASKSREVSAMFTDPARSQVLIILTCKCGRIHKAIVYAGDDRYSFGVMLVQRTASHGRGIALVAA